MLNQTADRQPVALPKDLSFNLPPGLIGNPSATQCTMADFIALVDETNLCPRARSGWSSRPSTNHSRRLVTKTVPVFNLVPAQASPRASASVIGKVPIVIDTSVRTGGDYGVVASVRNPTQAAGLFSSQVTLWGVPGDRGTTSRAAGNASPAGSTRTDRKEVSQHGAGTALPFLTLPTSCPANPASEPLVSSIEADSWANRATCSRQRYEWSGANGEPLGWWLQPAAVHPDDQRRPRREQAGAHGSTPTGLSVNVKVPQKTTLEARAGRGRCRDTTVTLPEGVQLSPAAANGLEACSEKRRRL